MRRWRAELAGEAPAECRELVGVPASAKASADKQGIPNDFRAGDRNGAGWRSASGVKGASWGARLPPKAGGEPSGSNDFRARPERSWRAKRQRSEGS